MNRIRRASLLIVLAHPDDEIFHGGVLVHLSERGVRVTLACATDGEAGKPHPSVGPVEDLGALRVEELRLSCKRLGIQEPVLLRFHDSARKERQRHDDPRALANVDMLDVEAVVRGIIADVKPHVIVTFEPHGGYYHPDHLAIQRATTAAFFSSGVMGDEAPERLFYGTMLRGDAEESPAGRSADAASVSSGDGARSVPPRRCARTRWTMAIGGFLRRFGNSRIPSTGGYEFRSRGVCRAGVTPWADDPAGRRRSGQEAARETPWLVCGTANALGRRRRKR